MILDILIDRLNLINLFKGVFLKELSPVLADRFPRGKIQRKLLTLTGLPLTGPNMRAINEALQDLGYEKITLKGQPYFKRVRK